RYEPSLIVSRLTPGSACAPIASATSPAPSAAFIVVIGMSSLCSEVTCHNARIARKRCSDTARRHPPLLQHVGAARHQQRLARILLDEQDRHAGCIDGADQAEHLHDQLGREAE